MKFRKVNIYKNENVQRLYLAPQLLDCYFTFILFLFLIFLYS